VSSLVGIVPGNNATLESLETVFNKDLNGDNTIGIPASSQVAGTTGNGSVTAGLLTANSSDHFHFNSGGAAGQTEASAPNGAMPNVWHDSFLFAADHAPGGDTASPASWAEIVPSSNLAVADIHAMLAGAHEDAFGSAAAPDAAHLWAHHSGFHFV
jgi:hypothetical protein